MPRWPSKIPLAWKNLTHNRRRLAVAIGGIGFAVLLMFMETGFQNALFDSTIMVLEEIEADLVLANKAHNALLCAETFDRSRIYQARGCPGVQGVYPLYLELYRSLWKSPGHKGHPIRLLAWDTADPVFRMPEPAHYAAVLQQPDTALFDLRSKFKKYALPDSPQELLALEGVELSGRSIRLVGTFQLGTDFVSDGSLILSAANFARFCPYRAPGKDPLSVVDLGIVRVNDGEDPLEVRRRLQQALPDDVAVYTKAEFVNREIHFWNKSTPIGYVFSVGTMIGFLVGVIICYQILYSDIADHMSEFATLKAMGYRNRYFVAFVLQESLYLSVLSFLPGLLASFALFEGLGRYTGLLMVLTVPRIVFLFLLTSLMCVVSGGLAMRKVLAADPAELF